MVSPTPLSARVHPHHLRAHRQHDDRCHQGVPVQDALLLRSLPHQRVDHWPYCGDPKLLGGEARAQVSRSRVEY